MNNLPATFVEGFHDQEAVKKMKYKALGETGLTVSNLSFGKLNLYPLNQQKNTAYNKHQMFCKGYKAQKATKRFINLLKTTLHLNTIFCF